MAQPTSIDVSTDSTEYSRYETARNTISATVQVSGGATYSSESILVELVKARLDRAAVVASDILTFTGTTDPEQQIASFYLPNIVDADLLNLVRHGRYFIRARSLATPSSVVIGSGTATPVTISTIDTGTDANAWTVHVVVPGGTSSLSMSVTGTALTINLGVAAGVPVAAQNTREAIVSYLAANFGNELVGSFTGTANLSLTVAEGPTSFTGGRDQVSGESPDFDVRIVTVERLKTDFLFGLPLTATDIRQVKFQPANITGATVAEISRGHRFGVFPLTYNYHKDGLTNATVNIGSGPNGTVTVTAITALEGSAGNAWSIQVVVPGGTSGLSVTTSGTTLIVNLAVSGGVPVGGSNTATLIAAAISAVTNFSAVASGTGASSISAASGPTAFTGGTDRIIRQLSWNGGPSVSITNPGVYILRMGGTFGTKAYLSSGIPQDYICVKVGSIAMLPTANAVDELLVDRVKIDDQALADFIEQATSWVENDILMCRVEPTIVVTDRDPTTIQFAAGINAPNPILTNPDFDFIDGPLTYFVPRSSEEWIGIQTPYPQLLRVDSLFGSIANTRVIDIDLSWIQHYPQGGFIQLVPFNQTIAFDFLGLIWVNAIRGAAAIPNFWHFNFITGLRDCPSEIQELIAKKAAMDALVQLGQALHPGTGSLSLGRDGVSQSISYTSQAKYGIYTGPITAIKDWMDENLPKFRGKYKGPGLVVV